MASSSSGSLERLRRANRESVLEALSGSELSRADIARATGLSRATVSSLVQELLHDRLVTEDPVRGRPHKGGSGRPPTLIRRVTPPGRVAGVDLGHRHVRVAIADLLGTVRAEQHLEIDVDHDAAAALDAIERLVAGLLGQSGTDATDLTAVGVGMPGPIDNHTGQVASSILPGWRGVAPAEELRHRLGAAVTIDNDAHVGALGELTHGAARGLGDVIYLKAAGGLGAGLILGGRLHRGSTGMAGEMGHVQLREDGPICRCGSRGCLETQVSAPRLVDTVQPAHDEELTVKTMLELGRQGNAGINRVLNDAGRTIGRVLADLCNHLNPAAIVVGGDLGGSHALLNGVRDSVDRYAQPDTAAAVRVLPAALGARSEVVGTIALALSVTSSAKSAAF